MSPLLTPQALGVSAAAAAGDQVTLTPPRLRGSSPGNIQAPSTFQQQADDGGNGDIGVGAHSSPTVLGVQRNAAPINIHVHVHIYLCGVRHDRERERERERECVRLDIVDVLAVTLSF